MNYILFDDVSRINLLPLTYTRPVADIRIGILTIREKWERRLNVTTSSFTAAYLSTKFPMVVEQNNVLINGAILPSAPLIKEIEKLETGQKLVKGDVVIALKLNQEELHNYLEQFNSHSKYSREEIFANADLQKVGSSFEIQKIDFVWDLFRNNGAAIKADYEWMVSNKESATLNASNQSYGEHIFIEEGANVQGASLNATAGPIYIGKNAEVMEGSLIRGPFALGEGATVKMGAKIYGPTTIGPHCKVGGEISNSVFQGYSNKGHDGFIGNSVIGEWCNLGADTNSSNLKNNYGKVKVWNYKENTLIQSNMQFCGLLMGDYSKSGINTMFNTATTVGVCANIYGSAFPPKFIPSFVWGDTQQWSDYDLEKAFEAAQRMMERRNLSFTTEDQSIFRHIFNISQPFRSKLTD